MEKDSDSLATVAVGTEKLAHPAHSTYAPSEVYSTSEPPPAYMKPSKSSAVQIARIASITLITMTVVLGFFILASSYVQARNSCTPESIAAMQAQLRLRQKELDTSGVISNGYLGQLQPEALVQQVVEPKDNLQSLPESSITKKEVSQNNANKVRKGNEAAKTDNENGDHEDDDDDYEEDDFPPVHIKLPLQLDLDDIAGALMQQARSRVSCVVEHRRADELMDGSDNRLDNNTDPHFQRLSGERVAILCESGNPHQEQQEQEMMTPIIVPLGTVQIPLQPQEANYNHYQVNTQYQVPDMQQLPLSDSRNLNHIPANMLPPELRNLPHITMEMRPPRMNNPQNQEQQNPPMEMRQIPIQLRHFPMDPLRNMRPPVPQELHQEPQMAMNYQQENHNVDAYSRDQTAGMMPPPPPPVQEHQRVPPQLLTPVPAEQQQPPMVPQQPNPELRPRSPFQGIPIEIRRIIQQVPLEIKNIIQHITGDARAFPVPMTDENRRENVQEFKPFPEEARPIPLGPFPLPIEVRNLLEHGNIEGRVQQREGSEEQQQEVKPFPGPEDQGEEVERTFPIPAEVRRIIHQVVEGRAIPITRFSMPLRQVESVEVPVEARAEVSDGQATENHEEQNQGRHQQDHVVMEQRREETEEENRPHYVQPRSVRSVPEPFAVHRREKRVRRCACDCAC